MKQVLSSAGRLWQLLPWECVGVLRAGKEEGVPCFHFLIQELECIKLPSPLLGPRISQCIMYQCKEIIIFDHPNQNAQVSVSYVIVFPFPWPPSSLHFLHAVMFIWYLKHIKVLDMCSSGMLFIAHLFLLFQAIIIILSCYYYCLAQWTTLHQHQPKPMVARSSCFIYKFYSSILRVCVLSTKASLLILHCPAFITLVWVCVLQ